MQLKSYKAKQFEKVTSHTAKYGDPYSELVLIQSAHTQQWTHTRSSEQQFMLRRPGSSWGFGALLKGTSVVVLKVERVLYIHSPHRQFLPARDSNPWPLGYESDSLTMRPQLPFKNNKLETEFCRNRDIVIINVDLFNIKFPFS